MEDNIPDENHPNENGNSPAIILVWIAVAICVLAWGGTTVCQNSRAADSNYQTPALNRGE